MLEMFDTNGKLVADWRVGKSFKLSKEVAVVDVNAICVDGLELDFLSGQIAGLVYPKNNGRVWWYAATAKTVASIMHEFKELAEVSGAFFKRAQLANSVKGQATNLWEKVGRAKEALIHDE